MVMISDRPMIRKERRAHERIVNRTVTKGGALKFAERHGTIPCVVRDLTEAGARVRVLSTSQIPDHVTLIIELDRFHSDCVVIWRGEKEIGLRFIGDAVSMNGAGVSRTDAPAPTSLEVAAPPPKDSQPSRSHQSSNQPIRVLIAEDDPDDRMLIEEAFRESNFDHPIDFVADGEELLAYLEAQGQNQTESRPGLILLDLNMPKMDGRQALVHLKSNPATRGIPVIVFTTSNSEEDIERTYDLGVSSYITKPSTFDGLMGVVKMLDGYWGQVVTLRSGTCS